MTDDGAVDAQRAAVRAARDAWQATGEHDPGVLAAVHDGLREVPVTAPASSWFGLPHQRISREAAPTLHRRRR